MTSPKIVFTAVCDSCGAAAPPEQTIGKWYYFPLRGPAVHKDFGVDICAACVAKGPNQNVARSQKRAEALQKHSILNRGSAVRENPE